MNSFDQDYKSGLLETCDPPCISLYQPTHRHHPDNKQDPIRFGNIVKTLEESLLQEYPPREVKPLLTPFLALAEDGDFWNHTLDGLAVLSAKGLFRVYRLQRPVVELLVVADSFHTKPLVRIMQSSDRYQVLGLSQEEIKLFEGNRDALDEIALAPGVPRTMIEALGAELTDPHHGVRSSGSGAQRSAMFYGQGGKSAEESGDAERFFRAVAQGILEHHSRPSALPLILATLPEHRQLFLQVSDNPYLVSESLDVYPDALSLDELRQRAWQAFEPRYLARLAALVEEFDIARSEGLAHDELEHIAKAIVAGQVGTLLIEAERQIGGRVDAATGDIAFEDLADPEVDDVLDDLGELALKMGGQVVIVPTEQMPTKTGVAAIYRY